MTESFLEWSLLSIEDECPSGSSHSDEAGGTLPPCIIPCSRDFPLKGPSGVQSLRHSQLRKRYLITRGAQGAIYAACDMLHPEQPREVIVKRLYPQHQSPYGSQGFEISILREATLLKYISQEQERTRAEREVVKVTNKEDTAAPALSSSSSITSSLLPPHDGEKGGSRVPLTSTTTSPPPSASVPLGTQIDESARIMELYRIVEAPFGEICLVLESCDMNLEHLYLSTSQLPLCTRDRAPDDNEERYSVGETHPMHSYGVFHALFDEQVTESSGEEVDHDAGCPGMRKGMVVDLSCDSSLPNREGNMHREGKGRMRKKHGWNGKKWNEEDSHSKEKENRGCQNMEGSTVEHGNACIQGFGCSGHNMEENHQGDEKGEKEDVVGKRWMEREAMEEGKMGFHFASQLASRELFPLFYEAEKEGDDEVVAHGRVHEEKKSILSSFRSTTRSSSLSSSSTTTTTSSCFSFFRGAISTIEAHHDDPLHKRSTEGFGLSGNPSGGGVPQYSYGALGVSSEWQNARHAMTMKAAGGRGGVGIRALCPPPSSSCGGGRGLGDGCPVLRELPVIRYLIRRLLRVLCFLHETCHVCHRDIKPSNWLIKIPRKGEGRGGGDGGGIRLGDFGSACFIPHDDGRSKTEEMEVEVEVEEDKVREKKDLRNLQQQQEEGMMEVGERASSSLDLPPPPPLTPGTFRMTRTYMAPECILGEEYGFKADMWSVGVTFIEIVLQRRLFWSISEVGVLSEIYSLLVEDYCEEEEEEEERRGRNNDGEREEEVKEKKMDGEDPSTCGVEDETKKRKGSSRPFFTKLSSLISPFLPPEGVEFAHSLLKLKQQQRLSASEALSHPFLEFDGWKEEDALGEEIWRKKLVSMT